MPPFGFLRQRPWDTCTYIITFLLKALVLQPKRGESAWLRAGNRSRHGDKSKYTWRARALLAGGGVPVHINIFFESNRSSSKGKRFHIFFPMGVMCDGRTLLWICSTRGVFGWVAGDQDSDFIPAAGQFPPSPLAWSGSKCPTRLLASQKGIHHPGLRLGYGW